MSESPHHLREAWDIGGRQVEDGPTQAELRAAKVWDDATAVAAAVCRIGWPLPPGSAILGLKDEAEPTAPE